MPELPEIETIKIQLSREILNKKIKKVIIKDKRLIKDISQDKFLKEVEGKTIQEITRRGKVLIIKLAKQLFLILQLRISGWLILSKEEEKFLRVGFVLSDNRILNFCDLRALGEIKLVNDYNTLSIIKEMGKEPFSLKREEFVSLFENKASKIKPLLMDQTFLAGVGNIYAQEALFCAKIHPEKKAKDIERKKLAQLYTCLIKILKEAIKRKGSSVDTYRQIDGEEGGMVAFLKVYQKEGKPCPRCKTTLKRVVLGGRGTVFCPECQK